MDSHMTIKEKPLGIIERFNGVDVQHTRNYIKLNNKTYIKKILKDKNIILKHEIHVSISISDDSEYNRTIESEIALEQKEPQQN